MRFTLIELLVVMAIIAILSGILFPALSTARKKSLAAKCTSNLLSLGTALQAYIGDSNEMMPEAALLPSDEPDLPRFCDIFENYVQTRQIFLCPSDPDSKYFIAQGSNYEYNTHLGGKKLSEDMLAQKFGLSKTFVLYDYESFHGKSGAVGARNYLFADGHVGELE